MKFRISFKKLIEYGIVRSATVKRELKLGKKKFFEETIKSNTITSSISLLSLPYGIGEFFKSSFIDKEKFEKFALLMLSLMITVIFFWLLGIPIIYSEGWERTCQPGTRCSEIWSNSGFIMVAGLFLIVGFLFFVLFTNHRLFLDSLQFKAAIRDSKILKENFGNYVFPEAHIQFISCLKYDDYWASRKVAGWENPKEAIKKAKRRLFELGILGKDKSGDYVYLPMEFVVTGWKGELDADEKKFLESVLGDLWDILMAYEYYEIVKKERLFNSTS